MADPSPPRKTSLDQAAAAFLAPAQEPDEIGRLGEYRVLKVLGKGGMGMVFKADDPSLKRTVALKIMLPEMARRGTAKERFLREAQAAAQLEHDHIISIFRVGEDRGIPYIAMSFLKGMNLDDWLKQKRPLAMPQILRIGREVAKGLAAAHERGLVHRDIKPANLWLDAATKGRIKILDFGVARAEKDDTALTRSGQIVGTPQYMSPEQAAGEKIDARSDLFSLGVVLYRLATGIQPFRGPNVMAVLTALATVDPPAAESLNPEVPHAFSELIGRLLRKNPDERIGTANEVVDAITAIERQRVAAKSSSVPTETGITQNPQRVAASQVFNFDDSADSFLSDDDFAGSRRAEPIADKTKRPVWFWAAIGAGVAALVLAVVGVMAFVGGGSTPRLPQIPEAAVGVVELAADGVQDRILVEQNGKLAATLQPSQRQAKLKPGRYTARATAAMLRVEPAAFVVESDGSRTLRLSREPASVVPTPVVPSTPIPAVAEAAWLTRVAALPIEKQKDEILQRLKELNPGFDGKNLPYPSDDFRIATDEITNIAPFKVMLSWPRSRRLRMRLNGSVKGRGRLVDISPLRGLSILILELRNNPIVDLTPLQDSMPEGLYITDVKVKDLTPLLKIRGMSVFHFSSDEPVDLAPLRAIPLRNLWLPELRSHPSDALLTQLRSQWSLEKIGDEPASEFWKMYAPDRAALLEWIAGTRTLPAAKQVDAVKLKMKELNPGFDPEKMKAEIVGDKVMRVDCRSDAVENVAPLRAFAHLDQLVCGGPWPKLSKLADLSPLQGLPLRLLNIGMSPNLADLSPLHGSRIGNLNLGDCWKIRDLSPLEGLPLTYFYCYGTPVSDLKPLAGAPINALGIHNTHVENLGPLKTMPIESLNLTKRTDIRTLRSLWSVTRIQEKPAIDFWDKADPGHAAYLRWIDDTRMLDPAKQNADVVRKLKDRNPAFDGKLSVTTAGDRIVAVAFSSVGVTDISPLRGFPNLTVIDCSAPPGKTSPLRDLSPLRGMKLTSLDISRTAVDDLEPIRWLPIAILKCKDAPIQDLSPLARMPLQELRFDLRPERDFRILAGIGTLTTINDQPAAVALRQFAVPSPVSKESRPK